LAGLEIYSKLDKPMLNIRAKYTNDPHLCRPLKFKITYLT